MGVIKKEIHLYHVYMVKCRDDSYYVGIAKNVEKRIEEHRHNKKRGSKYVRSRLPVELVYKTPPMEHGHALRLEKQLKKGSHKDKEEVSKFYQFLLECKGKLTHKEAYEKIYGKSDTESV